MNGIKFFILAEVKDLLAEYDRVEITLSRLTEKLNEMANEKLLKADKIIKLDIVNGAKGGIQLQ